MPDQNTATESKSASRPAGPPTQSTVDEPVPTPERADLGDETETPVPSATAPGHEPAMDGETPAMDGHEAAVDAEQTAADGETPAADDETPAADDHAAAVDGEEHEAAVYGQEAAAHGGETAADSETPTVDGVEEETPAMAGEAELDRAAVVEGEAESDRDAAREGGSDRGVESDRTGRDGEPAAEPDAAADQFAAEAGRPEPSAPAERWDSEADRAEPPLDRETEDVAEPAVAMAQADHSVDESRVDGADVAPDQDAQAELAPGDVPVPQPATLWSGEDTEAVRERWRELQSRFVDDPHGAAAAADDLIGETVESLTAALLTQRQELGAWRAGGQFDTEQLRVAITAYRGFLDRVLSI
jgi:hypothetical protein